MRMDFRYSHGGPSLPSDDDPDPLDKHSIASKCLSVAHNNNVPLAVCDSQYGTKEGVPQKEQTNEFALGWVGWDRQLLDYLYWKNENGDFPNDEQWNEIHEATNKMHWNANLWLGITQVANRYRGWP